MTTETLPAVFRGGNWQLLRAREREILVEGPRGTGKTFTILYLINLLCNALPHFRALIVRKYQRTLSSTCLRTFNEQVVASGQGVSFYGGSESEPAAYRYRNGSRILLAGMDEPDKLKGAEVDIVYVNEAPDISEDEWQSLLPLLRHLHEGKRLIEDQRLVGDCNPANAGHWLNQRCERGQTRRITTKLRDNPAYYDDDGVLTEAGAAYLATLTSLTGPRRERWLEGRWTGTENAIYPSFDRSIHVRPLEPGLYFKATIIGEDYGTEHLCAVAPMSIDQWNRRWVREVWAETDQDQGKSLNRVVGLFKERYKTHRGRVDPNQAFLAGQHGFSVAKGGNGGAQGPPRLHRIDLMEPLFYTFPGGRVPGPREEGRLVVAQAPFEEGDSPGFFLVEGMPGIDELADEIEGYHYVYTETPRGKAKNVYRTNENRIAAVEYANEEWEEGAPSYPYMGRDEQTDREMRRLRPVQPPAQVGYRRN